MLNVIRADPHAVARATPQPARSLYHKLLDDSGGDDAHAASREFLLEQLRASRELPTDLPGDPRELQSWSERGAHRVGLQYAAYLRERRAGEGRRYFASKSHALYFLRSVAPTKLVDGAWLYGLLPRWTDARFTLLIRTYLEELGDGVAEKNHVLLYKSLLRSHGCDDDAPLPDDRYLQGAIQLSLARHAADFLPEAIGYNLGYEQLPLHLPITAYELKELGIDPYYFSLHVTIDNIASGHARSALRAVSAALPRVSGAGVFYRRVIAGYRLNLLGAGTTSVIAEFDPHRELVTALAGKAAAGAQLHSDYCRIGGRTVNEWLADPGRVPAFLEALQQKGWIKRHQDPRHSRFWNLTEGERAPMFGVFTAYERQLLHDWIAGDHAAEGQPAATAGPAPQEARDRDQPIARGLPRRRRGADDDDFTAELRSLERELAALSREQAMARLIELMSPRYHHTAAGLMATRVFGRLFG